MDDRTRRRRIHRQTLSIALALAPFGIVFGVACVQADLGLRAPFTVVVAVGVAVTGVVRGLAG